MSKNLPRKKERRSTSNRRKRSKYIGGEAGVKSVLLVSRLKLDVSPEDR
jgi:hypothetical protein